MKISRAQAEAIASTLHSDARALAEHSLMVQQGEWVDLDFPTSNPSQHSIYTPPAPLIGDATATFLRHLGIDAAVKWLRPGGCGCARRQSALNKLTPALTDPVLHLGVLAVAAAILLALHAAFGAGAPPFH